MTSFSKHVFGAVLALSVVGCSDASGTDESDIQPENENAAQVSASKTIDVPVTLRGTGKAVLKATVYTNPAATGTGTILSVPGFTATGASYGALTAASFSDSVTGPQVKTIVTLDLPGHGGSTKPTGIKYGELTIEDNAAALVQALQALAGQNVKPGLLVGAGAGGLTIATAQEQLLASGSSLAKLGVANVLLYAPVPSAGRPWTAQPTPATINDYIKTSDADGAVYTITDEYWNRQAFLNKAGTRVASAPTPAQITAGGFNAPEPVALVSQLTGINDPVKGAPIPRPTVRAGAFNRTANGTGAIVVGFAEGIQVNSADVSDFYTHLSGDATKAAFVELTGPDAVSAAFLTAPKALVEATHKFFAPAK